MFDIFHIKEIKEKKEDLLKEIASLEERVEYKERVLKKMDDDIGAKSGIIEMLDMGMEYNPTFDNSSDAENQIHINQDMIAEMITEDKIWHIKRGYRIDGSETKGRQFQKEYCKNLLSGIDGYIRNKENCITADNADKHIELIKNKFAAYQKKANSLGFELDQKYLDCRIAITQAKLDMKLAKIEEREKIKEERRRIAEEEKLRIEAEKEKARLAAEKARWEKIFGSAMTDEKREEAKAKLEEISSRDAKIDYRLANIKSGWVYVISNPALAGMNKIGVTKRLDFTKRIDELSAAGVPFNFKVECVTFSDDCFSLEAALHSRFDSKRVNKENKHKEFFMVPAAEIINVMREEFNCDVHFIAEEGID